MLSYKKITTILFLQVFIGLNVNYAQNTLQKLKGTWSIDKTQEFYISDKLSFQSELLEFSDNEYAFLTLEVNEEGDTTRYHRAVGKLKEVSTSIQVIEWVKYEYKIGSEKLYISDKAMADFNYFEKASGNIPLTLNIEFIDDQKIIVLKPDSSKKIYRKMSENKPGISSLVIWY